MENNLIEIEGYDDFDSTLAEVHELVIALVQSGFFNSSKTADLGVEDIITTHKKLLEYYRSLEK